LTAQQPIKTKSGTVRITDSSVFPVSKTIAAALVEVQPGGMRELHWHPNTNEWQYYIEGQARMGVFAASGQARTFDYQAGDVGFVPFAMGLTSKTSARRRCVSWKYSRAAILPTYRSISGWL
jgi:oxalate decarboxylase